MTLCPVLCQVVRVVSVQVQDDGEGGECAPEVAGEVQWTGLRVPLLRLWNYEEEVLGGEYETEVVKGGEAQEGLDEVLDPVVVEAPGHVATYASRHILQSRHSNKPWTVSDNCKKTEMPELGI